MWVIIELKINNMWRIFYFFLVQISHVSLNVSPDVHEKYNETKTNEYLNNVSNMPLFVK